MTAPRDTVKTTARLNGVEDVDTLAALCAITGQRASALASRLLTEYVAAAREDEELGPLIASWVAHARAHQLRDGETGEKLTNVVSLDRRRRNA